MLRWIVFLSEQIFLSEQKTSSHNASYSRNSVKGRLKSLIGGSRRVMRAELLSRKCVLVNRVCTDLPEKSSRDMARESLDFFDSVN